MGLLLVGLLVGLLIVGLLVGLLVGLTDGFVVVGFELTGKFEGANEGVTVRAFVGPFEGT